MFTCCRCSADSRLPAALLGLAAFGESSIEGPLRGGEIQAADERAGLARAVFSVHAAVLPFHGERSAIAHIVERPDDGLEINRSVPRRTEIPKAARVAKPEVPAKDSGLGGAGRPVNILHVAVIDPVT